MDLHPDTDRSRFLVSLLAEAGVQLAAADREIERLRARVNVLTEALNEADMAAEIVAEHLRDVTVEHLSSN